MTTLLTEAQAALTHLLRALRAGGRSLDALSQSDQGTPGLQSAGEVLSAFAGLPSPCTKLSTNHPPIPTRWHRPIQPAHPAVAGLEELLRGLDLWGATGPPTVSDLDMPSEPAPHNRQSPARNRSRSRSHSRRWSRSRSRSRSRSAVPRRVRTGFDQQQATPYPLPLPLTLTLTPTPYPNTHPTRVRTDLVPVAQRPDSGPSPRPDPSPTPRP